MHTDSRGLLLCKYCWTIKERRRKDEITRKELKEKHILQYDLQNCTCYCHASTFCQSSQCVLSSLLILLQYPKNTQVSNLWMKAYRTQPRRPQKTWRPIKCVQKSHVGHSGRETGDLSPESMGLHSIVRLIWKQIYV